MAASLYPVWIGDFFCLHKKFLVYNLVARNLKTRYHRSFFGILWTLFTPLSVAGMYYFVFKFVFRVQGQHYLVYVLSGILPWTFFSQTLLDGMESIVGNLGLVSRVPVPLQTFAFAGMVTALFNMMLSLPVVLGASLLSGLMPSWPILLLPVYLVMLLLISYALSLFLAVGFVFFRDLRHLFAILLQVWFYGTPVLYSPAMIPERFHWILYANPLAPIFVGMREVLIEGRWPDPTLFGVGLLWFVGILGASLVFLHRGLRGLVEQI